MFRLRTLQQVKLLLERCASNYRRPQLATDPARNQLDVFKTNYIKDRTALTANEWENVREVLMTDFKQINDRNIDAVILGVCQGAELLPLAKNYLAYLRTSGVEPNAASLGRLLRTYNATYHARGGMVDALSASEQAEVLEICESLQSRHDVLDAATCENLIHGLVATQRWTDARRFLEMSKLTCTPTAQAYTEIAVKAFSMNQLEIGWELLNEMLAMQKQPKCEIFISYLRQIATTMVSSDEFLPAFERLLRFLEMHELLITDSVVNCLRDEVAVCQPGVLAIVPTKLGRFGLCGACGQHLENISTSEQEFAALSHSFLSKVLIRRDVFQKSTPEEMERFERFIVQTAPYDCVIDGLNVAYSMGSKKSPSTMANLLAAVVKYFNERHKRVLVLGRKHMNSWPKAPMGYVAKHASVFLTNNLSQDDPFLLYATLKSGPSADFFSRDQMRSHAYLLGTELKPIFRRWQQEHQYSLVTQTQSGKIVVKEPIRHRICAHKVNNIWHLPCKSTPYSATPPESFKVADSWLCVKLQNNMLTK